jgi:hypothetical protein
MFSIIKKITTLILPIIFALVLAATVPLYFLTQKITDREQVRTWFKNPIVVEKYREYIVDQIVKENNLNYLGIVINTEEIKELVKGQITDEWIEATLDNTIDATYDWLEGETDSPTLDITESKGGINDIVANSLDEKFGLISNLIDFQGMDFINGTIPLLDFNKKLMEFIPDTYGQIILLPTRILIVNGILLLILVFTSNTGRNFALRLGIVGVGFGATVLYAPSYLVDNPQILKVLGIDLKALPQADKYPEFAQQIFKIAQNEIADDMKYIIWGGIIIGLILLIASQLELKEVEVWEGRAKKSDKKEIEDGGDPEEEDEDEE